MDDYRCDTAKLDRNLRYQTGIGLVILGGISLCTVCGVCFFCWDRILAGTAGRFAALLITAAFASAGLMAGAAALYAAYSDRRVCQWLIEHGKMVWLQPCGATIDMAESRRGEAVYRVLYSYTDNSGNHVLSTPALCYNKAHELNHPDRELLFFIDPDNPELYYCDPEHDKHDTEKPKL